MVASTVVSQILTRWAHLYGRTPVSATLTYLHLVGILVGGGVAVAADRASLRLSPATPDWSNELTRLAGVHRWVVAGLALIFASGVLMMPAELDSVATSVVFWTKMGLIAYVVPTGPCGPQRPGAAARRRCARRGPRASRPGRPRGRPRQAVRMEGGAVAAHHRRRDRDVHGRERREHPARLRGRGTGDRAGDHRHPAGVKRYPDAHAQARDLRGVLPRGQGLAQEARHEHAPDRGGRDALGLGRLRRLRHGRGSLVPDE